MALSPRLELRQGQSLVITPQLQQAIKLLQLSNLELEAFVEGELERNPLLQRDETDHEPEHDLDAEPVRADAEPFEADRVTDSAAEADLDVRHDDLYDGAAPGDVAMGDAGPGAADAGGAVDWSKAGRGGSFEGDDGETPESRAREATLAEHLDAQLSVSGLTGADHAIAQVLIDAVDDGGYLRADLAEIAERLGCDEDRVLAVLKVLQGFEPTGVFARDVAECLRLQLVERDRFDPAMAALVGNLELLARRDMAGLKKACGVDDEDLKDMIAELRGLTPRPGAAFGGGEPAQTMIPDVFVREGPGGLWLVELNADTLPRLLVDQRYHARVSSGVRSDQEKTFVSDCLASANWLMRSLDQRAKTILKVASEIVRQQDGFLAFGVEHLRPLNLKPVADAIGMHESTVSRVTSNKYLATPRGVFEMKFFFTSAIASSAGGEAHSAESVRHKIRQLIDTERGEGDVHSDDAIVEILKEAGVDIARRTVAKYREAMRIPSSVERKRLLRETA
ncbi:MAG TPA: RNA polymerase factor sigma-54 [Caulobacteraceae bacterium]|nr:RNA polymerase factor sigma-54 [Caulobacteraceae bacterium]